MPVIDVAGLPMAYELRGSGVPLVLVAGTGYAGRDLGTLAGRARSRSSTPCSPSTTAARARRRRRPSAYSTRGFAADAVGLIDALGLEAAHVVGHSMGGRVAQWMALDNPYAACRSLVLAATGPGEFRPDKPVTRGIPMHTAVAMIEHGYEAYMREHIAATFFTPEFVESDPETASRGWWTRSGRAARASRTTCATSSRARSTRRWTCSARSRRRRWCSWATATRTRAARACHWEQSQALMDQLAQRRAPGHRGRRPRLLLAAPRGLRGGRAGVDGPPLSGRRRDAAEGSWGAGSRARALSGPLGAGDGRAACDKAGAHRCLGAPRQRRMPSRSGSPWSGCWSVRSSAS